MTAASLASGMIRHPLATGPFNTLAFCHSVKRPADPRSALARPPLETLAHVEMFLLNEAESVIEEPIHAHNGRHNRWAYETVEPTPVDDASKSGEDPNADMFSSKSEMLSDKMESPTPMDRARLPNYRMLSRMAPYGT